MDSERLKKIEEIYHAALDGAPDDIASILATSCGDDDELRREVESLLAFEKSPENFIDSPPESLAAEIFAGEEYPGSLIDETVGHYRIVSKIGEGGMGEVYLAQDVKLGRKVALKILPEAFIGDADRMSRFVHEAKSISALNHPNIITIYEIGESEGVHFIATEYIEGKTLNDFTRGKPASYQNVLDVAIQVASALGEAHSAGIVHRDIKPENIMIRPDGLAKVLDFGIAKLTEQETSTKNNADKSEAVTSIRTSRTKPGMIIGTADYMSPEQARGKMVDHRSDIFSFGVVLFEMLTGQNPFTGETVSHTIVNIIERKTPSIRDFAKDCPVELEQIIQKSLAKRPDDRPGTATELVSQLKKLQRRMEFEAELNGEATMRRKGEEEKNTRLLSISQSDKVPPNNLTENSTAIIGREKEIGDVSNLLNDKSVRLVTLTGIGGTGKTRLAQEIARRMLTDFSDGVFFVALAPVTDSKLVVSTVAQTLGVKESGGQPVLEALRDYLRDKQILLVVDNFEQVLDAGKDIAELLDAGDKLKILITSREHLHLSAEREYDVLPLAVPTDETQISLDELSNYEAVRFFVERARSAQADFTLTNENAASIAEICRRLDGLPLAIELAAARVKLFSPAAILNRLSDSLKLLTGGAKDLPERRQTMRGAIAWSYDLLDVDEKKMLRRLAVFRGGFSLDGAEKVAIEEKSAQAETQNTNSGIDIYDGISSLLEKSLIIRSDQKDGEPRFRMLVVVREFAAEKLEKSGEAEEIKRLHTNFYADFSEKAKLEINGAKAAEWYEKLEHEHDNIRAALRWTLDNEPKIALRFVLSNYSFWARHGYLAEGCKWMTEALEKSGQDADPKLRAEVYRKVAYLFQRHGDIEAAKLFGEEGLRLSRQIGDKEMISFSLGVLCVIKNVVGDFKSAQKLAEESLAIAREISNKMQIGNMLNSLGEIARGQEDYQAARKYYEDALKINEQQSNNYSHYYLANLACITYLLKDYQASRSYALEVLKINRESGDKINTGEAMDALAAVALKDGKLEKAARLSGAAAAIYESIGHKPGKVDQDFNDRYTGETRAAIGNEAFDAAFAEGRTLSLKEAIALAREGESDILSATHITNEANSRNTIILTNDALEAQTVIFAPSDATNPEISRPNNFLSNLKFKQAFVPALMILLLVLGGFFAYRYFATDRQIRSIAVLPFVNETGNANNEYLSDGLSDALINKLSQLPQLKVIARSSSFKYKGQEIDTSEIAKALGVQAIVTGRIAQRGDTLQINVELIDAAENTQIWGEQYNRQVSDALNVEGNIVRTVSEKLHLQLTGNQEQQMAKQATGNSQAYQSYLNGIFYRRRNGADNLRKAVEYQNQAIAVDPNFAQAYAELAFEYGSLVEISAIDPADGKPKARAAAEKAVALDDSLAEAHLALAYVENQDLNWAKAGENYKRAIELNTNFASAHTIYAAFLSQMGRFDEALMEIHQSQKLDPLRPGLIGNEGIILYYARRYDEAIIKMQEGLRPEPGNTPARIYLGQVYTAARQYSNAIRELETAAKDDSESTSSSIFLARAFALTGNRDKALSILDQLRTTKKYTSPAAMAILYASLGDKDAAFKSLEKAYAERDTQLQSLKVDPGYVPLSDEPRFKEMLRKMGLPE